MKLLLDIISRICSAAIVSFLLLAIVGFVLEFVHEDWLKKFSESKESMSVIKGMFFFGTFICFLVSFLIYK